MTGDLEITDPYGDTLRFRDRREHPHGHVTAFVHPASADRAALRVGVVLDDDDLDRLRDWLLTQAPGPPPIHLTTLAGTACGLTADEAPHRTTILADDVTCAPCRARIEAKGWSHTDDGYARRCGNDAPHDAHEWDFRGGGITVTHRCRGLLPGQPPRTALGRPYTDAELARDPAAVTAALEAVDVDAELTAARDRTLALKALADLADRVTALEQRLDENVTAVDVLFGYAPGQSQPPDAAQIEHARALLDESRRRTGPIPVKALDIAREILDRADT